MQSPIIQTPDKLIFTDSLGTQFFSKWIAGHNPVIFKAQRKDSTIATVSVSDTTTTVITSSLYTTDEVFAGVKVGQNVYLKTTNNAGIFQVTAVGSNYLIVNAPWVDGDMFQFVNFNDATISYYLEVVLTYDDSLTDTLRISPDSTGLATINLSSRLRSKFSFKNGFSYQLVNNKDGFDSGSISITITPNFKVLGDTDIETGDVASSIEYFVVNAAKQIGNKYSANMGEYVPVQSTEYPTPAKFLSEFVQPVLTLGTPFDLSFIYDGSISADIMRLVFKKDINGIIVGIIKTALANTEKNFVNRLTLPTDTTIDSIDAAVIINGDHYVQEGYWKPGYVEDGPDTYLTETKNIKFKQPCCNMVYLCWHNTVGGKSYWAFSYNQTNKLDVSNEQTFQQYIEDLESAEASTQTLSKTSIPQMIVGADNLTTDQVNGIKGIFESSWVQMLLNPDTWLTESPKWITVRPATGNFLLNETRAGMHSIEILLSFPERIIPKQ